MHLLYCTLYSLCGSFEISYAAVFSSGFRLHSHGGSWSWISTTEKPQSGFSPHKSCWAKLYAWNHLVVNSMAYLSHMRQLHCWGRARCWDGEREREQETARHATGVVFENRKATCSLLMGRFLWQGTRRGIVGFDILLRRCITGNDHLWVQEEAGLYLPQYHFLSTSSCGSCILTQILN